MKALIYKSMFLFILIGTLFTISCETSQDTFEEFVKDGEKVILSKPLEVIVQPGNERARFLVVINADPLIQTGVIQWEKKDGSLDTREFDVQRSSETINRDTLIVDINNIEEGARTFTFLFKSDDNKVSIPFEVTGIIPGTVFQSNLLVRSMAKVEAYFDSTALITWNAAPDNMLETTIVYTDKADQLQSITITNEETATEIPGFNPTIDYEVTSSFKSDPSAIDTFYVTTKGKFPPKADLNRSLIEYVQLPDDSDLGSGDFSLAAALDGNPDSPGLIFPFTFPNHFSLDLGVLVNLVEVELTPFSCCGSTFPILPKEFEIWGIADLTDATPATTPREDFAAWTQESLDKGWVKLLDVNADGDGFAPVISQFTSDAKVRYVRFISKNTFRHSDGGNTDTGLNNITFRMSLTE